MKVAVLSYPMLFQSIGGLQIQVLESIEALKRLGCDARLIDPNHEQLTDFDLVHVFAVNNGNHRIVEQAASSGIPVVLSPLVRPIWARHAGRVARLAESIVGRLTQWEVKTEYRQFHSGLTRANRCIALGSTEKQCIHEAFGVDLDRIDVIPNGVPDRFFHADGQAFLDAHQLKPGFVLCVASINSHKNQLGLAQAINGLGFELVLIGPCYAPNSGYLEQILAISGTRYVGAMNHSDPLLASAYAAAGLFALVSESEVMPLTTMEALAAGTPVVMTRNHSMDLEAMRDCVVEVDPNSASDIRAAIETQRRLRPSHQACKDAVAGMSWDSVGSQLLRSYELALRA